MELLVSIDDVRTRWPEAPEDDERLSMAIRDASAWLLMEAKNAGHPYDPYDEVRAQCFEAVCVSLIKRSCATSAAGYGISQSSETAGAYSLQMSYANPDSSFYLSKSERKMLGLNAARFGFARGCVHDSWTC